MKYLVVITLGSTTCLCSCCQLQWSVYLPVCSEKQTSVTQAIVSTNGSATGQLFPDGLDTLKLQIAPSKPQLVYIYIYIYISQHISSVKVISFLYLEQNRHNIVFSCLVVMFFISRESGFMASGWNLTMIVPKRPAPNNSQPRIPHLSIYPRDPITETENGNILEPKYYAEEVIGHPNHYLKI